MARGMKGVLYTPTQVHSDHRGWFMEGWRGKDFVQENIASNSKGVLRGLHLQYPPQGKLIRCLQGRIFDVVADPMTGQWEAFTLDSDKPASLWIPRGYAHGYYVLSDTALVSYAVDAPRNVAGERIIHWQSYGIEWPLVGEPILSAKDESALKASYLVVDEHAHGYAYP